MSCAVHYLHKFKIYILFTDICIQFSSVAQPCVDSLRSHGLQHARLLCHQFQELAQTHVHQASDSIQPSHPLLSPSPHTLHLSQHQSLFYWVGLHIRRPNYWSLSYSIRPSSEYSGLISHRMDWLDLPEVQVTLKSLFQQFKSINSSALSFLYSPTLTSIHDYWKNHSLD